MVKKQQVALKISDRIVSKPSLLLFRSLDGYIAVFIVCHRNNQLAFISTWNNAGILDKIQTNVRHNADFSTRLKARCCYSLHEDMQAQCFRVSLKIYDLRNITLNNGHTRTKIIRDYCFIKLDYNRTSSTIWLKGLFCDLRWL